VAWQTSSFFEVSFSFVDKNGHKARTSCNIAATTEAFAMVLAQEIAGEMQSISGASLRELSVTHRAFQDSPVSPTEQGEDKALFIWRDASYPPTSVQYNIPGCLDSILIENLIDIDLADADVADFVQTMTTPDINASQVVSANNEVLLPEPEAAYLSQRRSLLRPARRAG